jgi:2-methylisocitrate lyase-like PEP mutase family enzyme
MRHSQRLRQLLSSPGMQIAPGAYDGITAKIIEQAGFPNLALHY